MADFKQSSIIQNVTVSNGNSSRVNLAALGMFQGVAESTLGVNAIQINLKSDVDCYVQVYQGSTSATLDVLRTFNVFANVGDARTFQAVGSVVKVDVTNRYITSSTYFRLDTVLCPIVEALPDSLSDAGRLKTENTIIDQQNNRQLSITNARNLRVSQVTRLIGATYYGNTLDSNFYMTSTSGTSTSAVQSGGELVLYTSAASGANALVISNRVARYVASVGNSYRGMFQISSSATTNNTKFWGCTDAVVIGATSGTFTNGLGFMFKDNNLSLVTYKDVVASYNPTPTTVVANGSFNGNYGAYYYLDTNIHTYVIDLSNAAFWFYIDDILLHTLKATTSPLVSTLHLRLHNYNINTGIANGASSLKARMNAIQRLGLLETNQKWLNNANSTVTAQILKYGPGVLHRVSINTKGLGATASIILYDSLTATNPIASIDTKNGNSQTYEFHIPFDYGLCYSTTTNSGDLTVVYE